MSGKQAEAKLAEHGIIVNRNTVPGDARGHTHNQLDFVLAYLQW